MRDLAVIAGLALAVMFFYRRGLRGRPPTRAVRLLPSAAVALTIHIGFHALATAAPSAYMVMALVFTSWATFFIWTRWLARAPKHDWEDGGGGAGEDDGGGGGRGPEEPPSPGDDGGVALDWPSFERELRDYLDREREPEPEPALGR